MSGPLCTIIVPTWGRHAMLLDKCLHSIQAQGYPWTETLVVSDGPDFQLKRKLSPDQVQLRGWNNLRYAELSEHDPEPHYGHHCRNYGLLIASGEYIGYCDDDDSLRPLHCQLLAQALDENPDAGFAVSRMVSHGPHGEAVIGHGPPACGNTGTPMIMHRREIADIATWDHAGQYEDWDLVLAWINAGVKWVQVDAETVDVWPSLYR